MTEHSIYKDIAERTGGDIYIGVVGPVRSGKSTFIKRFMESLVLPNMDDGYARERARDEMPQSAAGKTVMTTEPKFIPDEAVTVHLDDTAAMRVKMIDCVGYIVPEALGTIENGQARMVRTPWSEEPMPFAEAAEMGTHKVITEHATIGMLITTDGSIGEISRESYVEAEERVVRELKEMGKPFAVILNSARPASDRLSKASRISPIFCTLSAARRIEEMSDVWILWVGLSAVVHSGKRKRTSATGNSCKTSSRIWRMSSASRSMQDTNATGT